MSSGINQDIEILGKVFHLQTQVCATPEPSIRTEVFLGGKLVATRDADLAGPAEDLPENERRRLLKEHHQKILNSIVERARSYRPRKEPTAPKRDVEPLPFTGPVPIRPSGKVDIALRVRRILERFRSRLGISLAKTSTDLGKRLERAAKGFDWVLQSPDFEEIRIDEQVRFNLLKDQIDEWLEGSRHEDQGRRIWNEVEQFNDYLSGINDREELAAFDRDQVRWALSKVEAMGMTDQLLPHLDMLRGRDVALDRLMDSGTSVGNEVWLAHLRRVLEDLESPSP